jgi:hypothetical protein
LATSAQLIMLEGETLKTRGMQLSVMMTVWYLTMSAGHLKDYPSDQDGVQDLKRRRRRVYCSVFLIMPEYVHVTMIGLIFISHKDSVDRERFNLDLKLELRNQVCKHECRFVRHKGALTQAKDRRQWRGRESPAPCVDKDNCVIHEHDHMDRAWNRLQTSLASYLLTSFPQPLSLLKSSNPKALQVSFALLLTFPLLPCFLSVRSFSLGYFLRKLTKN